MLSLLTGILLQRHIQPLLVQSFFHNMACSKPSKMYFKKLMILKNDREITFSSLSQQVLVSSLLLQAAQVKQLLCQVWNSA